MEQEAAHLEKIASLKVLFIKTKNLLILTKYILKE